MGGKVLKFKGVFGHWFEIRRGRVGGCSDLVSKSHMKQLSVTA